MGSGDPMELTWLGHATWLLDLGECRIMVDPFLEENPSAKGSVEDFPCDYILVTHGHFDHVADVPAMVAKHQCKVLANYEICTYLGKEHGIEDGIAMNIGGAVTLPFGRVKMTLAHHSSSFADGTYAGEASGFIVEAKGKRVYFAGDTALFMDMKAIGADGLDVAILPIGDLFTMGPADSVIASQWLGAQKVVPGHYNTWEPIQQDVDAWAKLIQEKTSATAVIPQVNQAIKL